MLCLHQERTAAIKQTSVFMHYHNLCLGSGMEVVIKRGWCWENTAKCKSISSGFWPIYHPAKSNDCVIMTTFSWYILYNERTARPCVSIYNTLLNSNSSGVTVPMCTNSLQLSDSFRFRWSSQALIIIFDYITLSVFKHIYIVLSKYCLLATEEVSAKSALLSKNS